MSTATAFVSIGSFPFCATDISGFSANYDYVDNLTLAQVMAFFWNLETFTITTAGTRGSTSAAGSIVLNPATSSTPFDRADGTVTNPDGAWYAAVATSTAYSSYPTFKTPVTRICASLSAGFIANFSGEVSTDTNNDFALVFYIGTDPSNAGKYRLYYSIDITYLQGANGFLRFSNPAFIGGGNPVLASGTFIIGGITMNWNASDNNQAGGAASGLALSATSSDYTY